MLSALKASTPCALLVIIVCFIGLTVLGSAVVACANDVEEDRAGETQMSSKDIGLALKEHTQELMSLSGVVGTGQGLCDNQPCIKVFVTEQSPDLEEKVNTILKGYPFVIQETGRFRTRPEKQE
jgi:hypothetical protein